MGAVSAAQQVSGLALTVRISLQLVVAEVAVALGLTVAELNSQLAGGSSLQEIAAALGVPPGELRLVLGRTILGRAPAGVFGATWSAVAFEKALFTMTEQHQLLAYQLWDLRAGWVAASMVLAANTSRSRRNTGGRANNHGGRGDNNGASNSDSGTGNNGAADGETSDDHGWHSQDQNTGSADQYQVRGPRVGRNLDLRA